MTIDLAGLTNAITDIIVKVTERELKSLGLKKASANSFKKVNRKKLAEIISAREKVYCSAGSPANTIFNSASLGLRTAMFGTIGNDELGESYKQYLESKGIISNLKIQKGNSGLCYILLTPDKERTNLAMINVARNFDAPSFSEQARIFHTSAYELAANPEGTEHFINYAKEHGSKISFDLADPKMIINQRSTIERIVQNTDILFMTEEESSELLGSPEKALKELSNERIVALKKGSKGSAIKFKSEYHEIPVYPVKLVSTCGAGDAYAAGFLFAHIRNFPFKECGHMGSYISSRVCGMQNSHF